MGNICVKPQEEIKPNEVVEIDIKGSTIRDPHEHISLEHFKFIKCIGTGSFGKVFLVQKNENNELYAMKILKKNSIKSKTQISQTRTERFILENVDSPFIVQLMYAFQSPAKLYIVMEFCQGGDIFGHMVKNPFFPENKIKFYAAEIFLALEKLHKENIVYRDLKPENILMTASGHIKLADFGLSKRLSTRNTLTYSFCGTAEYMAPEIITKNGHNTTSDWWSFGAVLYEMLNGAPPFYEKNKERMMSRIVSEDVIIKNKYTIECQSLLRGLLTRNRSLRLGCSSQGSLEIREHPFFATVDWGMFEKLKSEPPFIPKITNPLDLQNIDQVDNFLKMENTDTPSDQNSQTRFSKKNDFNGFTYERELEKGSSIDDSHTLQNSLEENPKFSLQ